MSVLYVILPIALGVAASAVVVFVWSVRRGQYDDLETPAMRILFDDMLPPERGGNRDEGKSVFEPGVVKQRDE